MDGLLEALYDRFYTPREMAELRRSVEANRARLRERLAAEDRKLVLRIVDDLTMTANEGSLDSFLCGFKLEYVGAVGHCGAAALDSSVGDIGHLRRRDLTVPPQA